MRVTEAQLEAAGNALGNDEIDREWVGTVLEKYHGADLDTLRGDLEELEEEFQAAGGRGVELADTIDALRVAVAVLGLNPYEGCTQIVPGVWADKTAVYIRDGEGEIVTWNIDEIAEEAEGDDDGSTAFLAVVSAVALAAKKGPGAVRANLADHGRTLQELVEETARQR